MKRKAITSNPAGKNKKRKNRAQNIHASIESAIGSTDLIWTLKGDDPGVFLEFSDDNGIDAAMRIPNIALPVGLVVAANAAASANNFKVW